MTSSRRGRGGRKAQHQQPQPSVLCKLIACDHRVLSFELLNAKTEIVQRLKRIFPYNESKQKHSLYVYLNTQNCHSTFNVPVSYLYLIHVQLLNNWNSKCLRLGEEGLPTLQTENEGTGTTTLAPDAARKVNELPLLNKADLVISVLHRCTRCKQTVWRPCHNSLIKPRLQPPLFTRAHRNPLSGEQKLTVFLSSK